MNTPLAIPFGGTVLRGDILVSDRSPAELLVLHGAGQGRRSRFEPLRQELFSRKIGSAAFDCVGHGETGGSLEGSSLRSRTEQAKTVVDSAKGFHLRHIFGSSMGAFTAVKLTALYKIDTLILNVPAVYASAAYEVPFGKQFSEIIRAPGSWQESENWDLLAQFRGNLVVLSAGNDEVIPREITDRIVSSATSAASVKHFTVPESSHLLSQYMNEHREVLLQVANLIESAVTISEPG